VRVIHWISSRIFWRYRSTSERPLSPPVGRASRFIATVKRCLCEATWAAVENREILNIGLHEHGNYLLVGTSAAVGVASIRLDSKVWWVWVDTCIDLPRLSGWTRMSHGISNVLYKSLSSIDRECRAFRTINLVVGSTQIYDHSIGMKCVNFTTFYEFYVFLNKKAQWKC
jgi:hypothetical protein